MIIKEKSCGLYSILSLKYLKFCNKYLGIVVRSYIVIVQVHLLKSRAFKCTLSGYVFAVNINLQ